MGFLKRLFNDGPEGGKDAVHSGGGFGSARDAMEALIARMYAWDTVSAWVTFMVPGKKHDGRPVMIEVGQDKLNMLLEELPADIVAAAGLERVGDCLYQLPGSDAKAIADVVDTVFRTHFGMDGDYPVHGRVQA